MADKIGIDKLVLSDERLEGLKAEYEEILGETWSPYVFYLLDAISLETAKKYHKWLDEPCTEHWKRIIPHRDCVQCQRELSKLLEEG